jgi:hypothetical protein
MLLIKDLSARLPYAVKVEHTSGFRGTLHNITVHHMYDDNDNIHDAICYTDFFGDGDGIYIEYFKPYLFPLSSMTEEQKEELMELMYKADTPFGAIFSENIDYFDWLNKNHFDYRGLIEKGLANDATNKNVY